MNQLQFQNLDYRDKKVVMKLQTVLDHPLFHRAKVLTHHQVLNQEVSSVMVLEAPDIEHWGAREQLILTSYYALINLSPIELEDFFEKLRVIQISGIVFKVNRLIESVPGLIIELCNRYDIPLIEIDESVKYEHVLFSVLQPIINENSRILNAYYDARKTISHVSKQDLSLTELLLAIEGFFHDAIQFESHTKEIFYANHDYGSSYEILSDRVVEGLKYVENTFHDLTLKFPSGTFRVTRIDIPNLLDQSYTLTIFKPMDEIQSELMMLLENAMELLLTNLLKIYAIKKNQSVRKNNQMHDLLLSRYYSKEERDTILRVLGIDKHPYYQGFMVSLYGKVNLENAVRSSLDPSIQWVRSRYSDFAYFQKNQDILFLINLPSKDDAIHVKDLGGLLDSNQSEDKKVICHIGISSVQDASLQHIHDNLVDLKSFMKVIHKKSTILEHDKIGFFKMFYRISSIEDLYEYVPVDLYELVQSKPEFALTLMRFIEHRHNYVKTSEHMYLHPKTIRYRIDKITERLNLNFDDPEHMLSIQVALKICEYTGLLPSM